jgi:hypothetical protein
MAKIVVDRASLRELLPRSLGTPPLLLAFADWVEKVPYGGIGYFEVLRGQALARAFPDPPPPPQLEARLGLFMGLPDGSHIALWDHGAAQPAVVLLGSEGELENVAPNLGAFFVALSRGTTGVNDLDDEDAGSHRDELAEWLKRSGVADEPALRSPSFRAWYEATMEGREPPVATPSAAAEPFDMRGFSAALEKLCGRPAEDSEVKAWVAGLGMRLGEPDDFGTVYADNLERGFCLSFAADDDAGGALALKGCHLYSEGHEEHRAFAHPLPLGITWQDTAASLARLGAPSAEIKNKKTGRLSSHRWWLDEATRKYVSVSYADGGTRIDVIFVGQLT